MVGTMEAVSQIDLLARLGTWIWYKVYPPRPKLFFENVKIAHWYDKNYDRSGVNVRMSIINRGTKTTTINGIKILEMNPDFLKHLNEFQITPFELPVNMDRRFTRTFFFRGAYLRYETIELEFEFTYTEGIEVLPIVSSLMDHLEAEF